MNDEMVEVLHRGATIRVPKRFVTRVRPIPGTSPSLVGADGLVQIYYEEAHQKEKRREHEAGEEARIMAKLREPPTPARAPYGGPAIADGVIHTALVSGVRVVKVQLPFGGFGWTNHFVAIAPLPPELAGAIPHNRLFQGSHLVLGHAAVDNYAERQPVEPKTWPPRDEYCLQEAIELTAYVERSRFLTADERLKRLEQKEAIAR